MEYFHQYWQTVADLLRNIAVKNNTIFDLNGPNDLKLNEYKFRIRNNYHDAINPKCTCETAVETVVQYVLHDFL